MARLIDADQFKAKLLSFMDRKSTTPSDTDCILDGVLNLLEKQPTIDPVKHGYWVQRNSVGSATCSICNGLIFNYYDNENHNYCPNCGAKMEGDGK